MPRRFNVTVPEHHQIVEITFALRAQDADGSVLDTPLLLGLILPPKTATTGRAPAGSGTWTAGPADRLAHALRMRKVPLGHRHQRRHLDPRHRLRRRRGQHRHLDPPRLARRARRHSGRSSRC